MTSWDLPMAGSAAVIRALMGVLERQEPDTNLGLWTTMLLPRVVVTDERGPATESGLRDKERVVVAGLFTRAWQSEAAEDACKRQRACAAALARGQAWARLHAELIGDAFLGPAHPDLLGMSFHQHWGAPRLAASGIRGVARAVAPDDLALDLFGTPRGVEPILPGVVTIFDGVPKEGRFTLVFEGQTPHAPGDYLEGGKTVPAELWSPRPFTFLVVRETTFVIDVVAKTPRLLDELVGLIEVALEGEGAGGKRSAGFGRMRVTRVES